VQPTHIYGNGGMVSPRTFEAQQLPASTPSRQHLLDLVEVLAAMLRAQQVDRTPMRRVPREQFVRQLGNRLIGRAGSLDGQRGGPARRQRKLRGHRSVVDPVHVERVLDGNRKDAMYKTALTDLPTTDNHA
jgi:hypothetical protein